MPQKHSWDHSVLNAAPPVKYLVSLSVGDIEGYADALKPTCPSPCYNSI